MKTTTEQLLLTMEKIFIPCYVVFNTAEFHNNIMPLLTKYGDITTNWNPPSEYINFYVSPTEIEGSLSISFGSKYIGNSSFPLEKRYSFQRAIQILNVAQSFG